MNRWRQWSVIVWFAVLFSAGILVRADSTSAAPQGLYKSPEGKPAEWLVDRSLIVTPQTAPVPVLKYRLFPVESERKDGNAVPIYLRLVHEQKDAAEQHWRDTPNKWNELPLEMVPLADGKMFLGEMTRFLRQIELGARRKSAEWNYTLDQGSAIDILLPDVQTMRAYIPMMVLQTRVAIREGDYAAAAHNFATGFAFGRQVAEGPFLINGLVGMACASQFADRLPEWIEQPGAPNLYWALTALPQPLINLRNNMEFEQRFLEMQFPDFADLDRPRTPEQWDTVLKQLRTFVQRIVANPGPSGSPAAPATDPNEPAARSPDLPAAKKYLADCLGKSDAHVAAMPPAQILLLYIVGSYSEFSQDLFKATYLPFAQARPVLAAAEKRREDAPTTEAVRLARLMLPALVSVNKATNRLERKVAALRVIEALRLHAAANNGRLPDALTEVNLVPVPDDPGTGKPFEYRREGPTATIISRIPGEPLESTGLRYRVTVK